MVLGENGIAFINFSLHFKGENRQMPTLRYGHTTINFQLPPGRSIRTVTYNLSGDSGSPLASAARVRHALAAPIGSSTLRELARSSTKAVILIPDGTRLCPSPQLLEPLLEELNEAGIADDRIDVVVALGYHRRHTDEELRELVSDPLYRRVRVHNHSCLPEDCVYVGTTTLGTPVEINLLVAAAPLRIVIGNIEPHSLVGISGGVKALVPGAASKRCIEHNHALSLSHKVAAGSSDNPIHRDLEEAQRFVPIHFMLNVIVDHDRHILDAVAGDVVAAHQVGRKLAADRFLVPAAPVYDVVVASPGGHPKDLHMYQAIKTLRNAAAFTKPGGTIVLAAECPEMLGNGHFQAWLDTMDNRSHTVAKLKERFVLGAHKILHVDEILAKHRVYLLSAMPRPVTQLLGFTPVESLDSLLEELMSREETLDAAFMPYGALTFPQPTSRIN